MPKGLFLPSKLLSKTALNLFIACFFMLSFYQINCMQNKQSDIHFEYFFKSVEGLNSLLSTRKSLLSQMQSFKTELRQKVARGSYYFGVTFLCDAVMDMMATAAGVASEDLTLGTQAIEDLQDDTRTLIEYCTELSVLTGKWYNANKMLKSNREEIDASIQKIETTTLEIITKSTKETQQMNQLLLQFNEKINPTNWDYSGEEKVDEKVEQLFGTIRTLLAQ